MSQDASVRRIIDIADMLNDNLIRLDKKGKNPLFRADLLFKMALAYFIQNDTVNAKNYLAQAKKVPRKVNKNDLFLEIIRYWELLFSDDLTFNEKLDCMEDNQIVIFEVMLYYSSLLFHEIPVPYLEALSCVAAGRMLFLSRKMMKEQTELPKADLLYDNEKGLYFFEISDKKIYYLGDDADYIRNIFYTVNMIEQAPYSPHLYFTENFGVKEGDVFCDIGAAEANIALNVIDKCDEVYIFEGNEEWNRALNATFLPYQEKTTIINKMVSDINDDEYISLDSYFGDKKVDFLKLDVEGFEMNVLRGAVDLLKANPGIRLCVCTYHNGSDADEIKSFLETHDFETEFSEGFMMFPFEPDYYEGSDPEYPYFRHGLIRARKK